MDKLKECALAFESLCNFKYKIIVGRKGKPYVEFKLGLKFGWLLI